MKKTILIIPLMLAVNYIIAQNYFVKEPYIFFKNKVDQTTGEVLPELDKIVVKWQLNDFYMCDFFWSTNPPYGPTLGANYESNNIWSFELDLEEDVLPETLYYFSAIINDDPVYESKAGTFITPPDNSVNSLTFYAYGDPQNEYDGIPSARHNLACQKINQLIDANPSSQTLLLNAGDWNKSATEVSWNENYFNNNLNEVKELLAKIPVMGVYGNHDMWDAVPPVGPMIF